MGDLNLQYYKSRSVRVLWGTVHCSFRSGLVLVERVDRVSGKPHRPCTLLSGTGALRPRASRSSALARRATAAAASGTAPTTGRRSLSSHAQRLV